MLCSSTYQYDNWYELMAQVTQQQIANRLGLSQQAVAIALSSNPNSLKQLRPETRQLILGTVKQMGYVPHHGARSLRLGKTHSIGHVGSSLVGLHMERVGLIATLAVEMGYQVLLAVNEDGDCDRQKKLIDELLARRVDGLIISITPDCDTSLYRKLRERNIPLVLRGYLSDPGNLPIVSVDVEEGVYQATRHLLDLGHRDIAMGLGKDSASVPHNRLAGCERALAERGLMLGEGRVLKDRPITFQNCYDFTRDQLSRTPRPTAIIYSNDEMAFVGMRAIHEMGLEVPRDISVVGVDDIPLAAFGSPPLTTIRQPIGEVGRCALELLMKQINGFTITESSHVVLKPELVIRQSTGPARGSGKQSEGKQTQNRKGDKS